MSIPVLGMCSCRARYRAFNRVRSDITRRATVSALVWESGQVDLWSNAAFDQEPAHWRVDGHMGLFDELFSGIFLALPKHASFV